MLFNKRGTSNRRMTVDKKFILTVLLMGFAGSLQAADAGWMIKLQGASAGAVSTAIGLGEYPNALDDYDRGYDGPAFPGSGRVNLYFERSAWGSRDSKFWFDIKSLAPVQQWDFDANATLYNQNLTITWDLSKLPADYALTLGDGVSGAVVDMRAQASYTYLNSGPRRFLVTVEQLIPEEAIASGPGKGKGPDINRLPAQARVPETAGSGNAYGLNGMAPGISVP